MVAGTVIGCVAFHNLGAASDGALFSDARGLTDIAQVLREKRLSKKEFESHVSSELSEAEIDWTNRTVTLPVRRDWLRVVTGHGRNRHSDTRAL